MKTILRILGLLIFATVTPTQTASAQLYDLTDLGTLGGNSYATGINASGQVVGYFYTGGGSNGNYHAFLRSNGVMEDLGTLGGNNSLANGINDSGQVVGGSSTSSGYPHAFRYSKKTMQDLGTLGGNGSGGNGINANGQVVGSAYTSGGILHAYLFSNGKMTDITPSAGSTDAAGINSSGQVLGVDRDSGNVFLYLNGSTNYIGAGEPYGINESGHAVGQNTLGAFLYRDGVMQIIGSGAAVGINNSDQVVGTNASSAFLYSNGLWQNLNGLVINMPTGWTLTMANGINDLGQIVGTMKRVGFNQEHAVLLIPVPSPATLGLLVLGSAVMIGRRRR